MTIRCLPTSLFDFLEKLAANNDRDWFTPRKDRYRAEVLQPAVEFVAALEGPLAKAAPMLVADARGHGGSVMRIYRDTRFSNDKTPYKTNLGINLPHAATVERKRSDDPDALMPPGGYLHVAPEECFVGAGCWCPPPSSLKRIRAAIDDDPDGWRKATGGKRFRDAWHLGGDSLKTAPRDYPRDHPLIEDLRRKDFVGISPLTREELTTGDAVKLVIDRIRSVRPLMAFLCDAVGEPY